MCEIRSEWEGLIFRQTLLFDRSVAAGNAQALIDTLTPRNLVTGIVEDNGLKIG